MAAHTIAPSLYVLFNKSLNLGHVPRDWKLARVTPLYKGKGSKSELGNYRPISVISHIPKIIEKFVSFSFNKFLSDNSLLHNDQFAYRKSQSTVNALHTLVDSTMSNINNGMLTGIVQLDLTKGFDLVNHEILLFKLNKYGVVNNCLSWFESYLSDRQQLVHFNGSNSSICNLSIGVPQGTILGPTLFVLYINDFSNSIGPLICIRYADDTSLGACDYNLTTLQSKLQSGTDKAIEWLNNNRLLVNSNKCSCMLIGSRQRIANLSLDIYIAGNILEMCTSTKLLGIYIDNCLSWDKQIEYLSNKLSPKLGVLYRLSKFTPSYLLNTIYSTLIQPDIDYCISIWGNCAATYLNKIQSLQNRAVRILCNVYDWNVSSSALLSRLSLMSVPIRRDYFIGILMFKTVNGFGLEYLLPELTYVNQYHNYNTRAASNNLIIPNKPNCELYKTSMHYKGIQLWNKLPVSMKNLEDITQFKFTFKNHLKMS
jgi:hypothetical protein